MHCNKLAREFKNHLYMTNKLRTLTPDGHLSWIAAKIFNVVLNPLQCQPLFYKDCAKT